MEATTTAQGKRISRAATISLNAPIEEVFPLFGPILEMKWAPGWNPEIIYSETGLVEEGMIFRTKGTDGDFIWVVSKYLPAEHVVQYTVQTTNRMWFINVVCKSVGNKTCATVTYTYTSLNDEGIELNRKALTAMFADDLKDWEEAVNFYLDFGRRTPAKATTAAADQTPNQ